MGVNPLSQRFVVPVLSATRCQEIVAKANLHEWTTARHKNYPTTDIPVSSIRELDLTGEVSRISELCMRTFGFKGSARAYDVFVVKYEPGGQDGLDVHRDSSELSFVVALNDPLEYEGGGTFYEGDNATVLPSVGEVAFHCGKLRHGARAVTRGTRYVLIGFLDVDSPDVRKAGSETVSNAVPDSRYLDYLYKHAVRSRYRVHVRVINLLHRRDKLTGVLECVNRIDVPPGWTMDVQVVIADGGNGHTGYDGWPTGDDCSAVPEDVRKYWQRPVTTGEIGCFVSHMNVLQNTTLASDELLLVLEDDARFYSDLLYRVDQLLPKEEACDGLDLGGVRMMESFYYQTHCILYTPSGVAKMQPLDYDGRIIPFDEFLNVARGVHPRADLKCLWGDLPPLALVAHKLSWQEGNVHDTEDREPVFTRLADDYDLVNYYKFKRCDNVDEIVNSANRSMWNFHLSHVKRGRCLPGFRIYMTRSVKLVAACILPNGRVEFQHNGHVLYEGVVVFPAYLSVKLEHCDVHFGCGCTFF